MPVVKFKLTRGAVSVSVDVVYVSMASHQAPTTDQLLSVSVFNTIAKETRMSLQGLRTVLELRRRVPVPWDVFTTVLKAVKFWAVRRGVYGNNFAFPPGVTLAIMVARTCQVYPAHHPSVLLRFFFMFYTQWLARHNAVKPLFITEQVKPDLKKVIGMWESWDPNRESVRDELLPVINPAFPSNNTSYNVGRSGLEQFYREITRGHLMLQRQAAFHEWETLWEPYHIGEEFSSFMVVEVPPAPSTETTAEDLETAAAVRYRGGAPQQPQPQPQPLLGLPSTTATSASSTSILPTPPSHPPHDCTTSTQKKGLIDDAKDSSSEPERDEVIPSAVSDSQRAWYTWVLYLESKLKVLIYALESQFTVRVWPKRLSSAPRTVNGCAWAIGIRLQRSVNEGSAGGVPSSSIPPAGESAAEIYKRIRLCCDDFQRSVVEGKFYNRNDAVMRDPMCYLMSHTDERLPHELRHQTGNRSTKDPKKRPRSTDR